MEAASAGQRGRAGVDAAPARSPASKRRSRAAPPEEVSALLRPDARRAKSAPRARGPAQHKRRLSALKDEFSSFSQRLESSDDAGGPRQRPRTPRSPRTPRRENRPEWSTTGLRSRGLGNPPRGQAPTPEQIQSALGRPKPRSKSTPRLSRAVAAEEQALAAAVASDSGSSPVYSRRLARRHAALQREVEVATVVETAAAHGVIGTRKSPPAPRLCLEQRG